MTRRPFFSSACTCADNAILDLRTIEFDRAAMDVGQGAALLRGRARLLHAGDARRAAGMLPRRQRANVRAKICGSAARSISSTACSTSRQRPSAARSSSLRFSIETVDIHAATESDMRRDAAMASAADLTTDRRDPFAPNPRIDRRRRGRAQAEDRRPAIARPMARQRGGQAIQPLAVGRLDRVPSR